MKNLNKKQFIKRVLNWFDVHGRKNLPWQKPITPYRVWVSEVMLQQTQVSTVIPYFKAFIKRFPNIKSLATADIDEVLHHWTGLGYYARGRNLHKTAQIIHEQYRGCFPKERTVLETLPGLGRSTAAAIAAIAFHQQEAILDGNVKRVLARVHAVSGWPGQNDVVKQLWEIAQTYTPKERVADYTQAMMDLGATLCTSTKPDCTQCPLKTVCKAYELNQQHAFPGKKPRKNLPVRTSRFILLCNKNQEVLLERRPPTGIWGGLWCFPQCDVMDDVVVWCRKHLAVSVKQQTIWDPFRHTFSHFHFDIEPVQCQLKGVASRLKSLPNHEWYSIHSGNRRGFATPVKKLLSQLEDHL